MVDPTPAPDGARCPRWVKIVLGLSLAANLAIAGAVAGALLRGGPLRDRAPVMGYATPYVIALPGDARREVFRSIRNDDRLPKRSARRAHYAEMIDALRTDPFDRTKVEAILTRQGQSVGQVQDVAQAAWLAAVAEMSSAERATYIGQVEDILRRGPRHKNGDRK